MSLAYEQKASAALQQLGLSVAEKQLDQAAQQAAAASWSYTHFLGYLLDAELRFRHEKTVRLNLQFADLPYQKRLDTFGYHARSRAVNAVTYGSLRAASRPITRRRS